MLALAQFVQFESKSEHYWQIPELSANPELHKVQVERLEHLKQFDIKVLQGEHVF